MPLARLDFRPYDAVRDEPHVVVDGSPNDNTVLTLSHWPGSPALPAELRDDLSAQIAFRYLGHPEDLHGTASSVSNNHFDQDGLVGVLALTRPDDALPRRELLEDVAAAGDFGTYRYRDAARASMVVAALADPERSPLGAGPDDPADTIGWLYAEALDRIVELVDHVDRYRDVWGDEDAQLGESEAAIAEGHVTLEEHPDVDLAVVTVPEATRWAGHRFFGRRFEGVHPMALHNATERGAVLVVRGAATSFTYRYESWVQYRSRQVRPRVDLGPLAERLSADDTVSWTADPVDTLTPMLAPVDPTASSLSPGAVTDRVLEHLRHAEPAFDPFTPRHGDRLGPLSQDRR